MALYEERDSGNVDYLAPFVDVFNEVFRGQIRLIQSKKPCGGRTIGLMQYKDESIQNTEVFDIVFNGMAFKQTIKNKKGYDKEKRRKERNKNDYGAF